MSKPKIVTICDKCGKEDGQELRNLEVITRYWVPKGWAIYNTQDGNGPEPDKIFTLCDKCELAFKLSIREFKP